MSQRPKMPNRKEVEAIKAGERQTINRVYIDNYDFIRAVARGYLLKKAYRFDVSDIDELANEVYLQFSELDFEGVAEFTVSLYDTFCFFHYGGKKVFYRYYGFRTNDISLDTPVGISARSGEKSEGSVLVELLESPAELEVEDNSKQVFMACAKFLSPKEREIFFYQVFTGFSSEEIAQALGKSRGAVLSQMCTLKKVLILHYSAILRRLYRYGCMSCLYYLKRNIVPPELDEVQAFYERRRQRSRERARKMAQNEEWRAKKVARTKAWRAKKRQERQKAD